MNFLIIGCGSIGQRHISNLSALGYKNLQVYDSNKKLINKIHKKFDVTIQNRIDFRNIDCTLICTPPNTHIKYALEALKKGSHVFVEKPLSNSLKDMSKLTSLSKKLSQEIFVGYSFRFDIGLQKIKKILERKTLGKIISFDAYEGWYLPNWRPWQNYQKSYTGSKSLGGGIILDGSHEINYLQWFGGEIKQIFSYYTSIPKLKVKAEGLAEILVKFKSGAIGRVHLDFINPQYNRHCEILCENGSIDWSFENKTLKIHHYNRKKTIEQKYGKDNNQMYVDEIKYVLKCINGEKNNLINLEQALQTLKISLAIKKSGRISKPITF